MRYVEEVLKDEAERLGKAIHSYLREIQHLPRGSVQNKKIRGHLYPYLAVREGPKVRYRYLGHLPEAKLHDLSRQIELRRRYRKLLAEAKQNQKRLQRMLHARRRPS